VVTLSWSWADQPPPACAVTRRAQQRDQHAGPMESLELRLAKPNAALVSKAYEVTRVTCGSSLALQAERD